MAVKPITNNQAVNKSTINRANQRSFRNTEKNTRQGVVPGKNISKGFAITLRDIDETVLGHVKNGMNIRVKEANEMVKVPVLYGNEERWKAFRKNGVLRDKNGTVILPVIVIRRTEVAQDDRIPSMRDQKDTYFQYARSNVWSKTNYYDRFSVQMGKKPVQERITTGLASWCKCTYEIAIATSYMDQMNQINEIFVEHLGTLWGESENYKFQSEIQGSLSDATEMTADGERIVKTTVNVTIQAYLIPEYSSANSDGKLVNKSELSKHLSPSRVVFGTEIS